MVTKKNRNKKGRKKKKHRKKLKNPVLRKISKKRSRIGSKILILNLFKVSLNILTSIYLSASMRNNSLAPLIELTSKSKFIRVILINKLLKPILPIDSRRSLKLMLNSMSFRKCLHKTSFIRNWQWETKKINLLCLLLIGDSLYKSKIFNKSLVLILRISQHFFLLR